MKESVITFISILALIGLSLIIGLIVRFFDPKSDSSKENGTDYMVNTLGNGCGYIVIISSIVGSILALLCWLFS